MVAGCVNGCRRGVWNLQRSTRLWPVSRYPISNDAPDPIGYNAVAVRIIRTKRVPVYSKPYLLRGTGVRTAFNSKDAKKERERRDVERRLYQKLSQYYPLPEGMEKWVRPPLLVEGKHGNGHSSY